MVINNYSTDAKIARWVSSIKPKPRDPRTEKLADRKAA